MVSQVHPPARDAPVVPANIDAYGNPIPATGKGKEVAWEPQQEQQEQQYVHNGTMWHVHNRWGLFAWIEFGLKIVGCVTAFISLTTMGTIILISLVRIVEIILFVPLVLGLIIPLIAAYAQRESFNFFYVAITFLAHIAVVVVLLFGNTGMDLIVFCTLMAVGEFFRLVFLEATPARKLPPSLTVGRRRFLVGFVFTYIAVYLAVLVMETMTVIDQNKQYISYVGV